MKRIRRAVVIAAIAIVSVLSLTGCSKSVDFLSYADVTFDGTNGNAVATVTVDYDKFGADVLGKSKTPTAIESAQTEASMLGEVDYTVTPSEGLSNGDEVVLKVSVSDAFLSANKLTVKELTKSVTVSGLKEPEMIDPFDDSVFAARAYIDPEIEGKMVVTLSGTLPYLTTQFDNRLPADSPLNNVSYSIANPSALPTAYKDGDTITIKATPNQTSDFSANYALTRDTYELPVNIAPKYISSTDDITSTVLDAIKPIVDGAIADKESYGVRDKSVLDENNEEVSKTNDSVGEPSWLDTAYFLHAKDGVNDNKLTKSMNYLMFPYEIEYSDASGESAGTAIIGVLVKNVIINADGSANTDAVICTVSDPFENLDAYYTSQVDYMSNEFDIHEFDYQW